MFLTAVSTFGQEATLLPSLFRNINQRPVARPDSISLFFAVAGDVADFAGLRGIWRTDGTVAGTFSVGSGSGDEAPRVSQALVLDDDAAGAPA